MRFCNSLPFTVILSTGSLASAAVFDLHNLGTLPFQTSLTVDGLTLFVSGSSGVLTSTSSSFGVDGTGANDAATLLDGGNGTREDLSFSLFDGSDAGTATLKHVPLTPITLHDGLNTINISTGSSSANFIDFTGSLASGGTNGFSVDAITAHVVPEPGMLSLIALAGTLIRRGARR
jgi:hypothetical protein